MKKYNEYKDSGVEWIGEIPEHWISTPLKRLVKIGNGKDYKDIEVEKGGYPVLGTGGIFSRCSSFLHDKPSVLLGRKGTIDKPQFIEEPFWTSDTVYYTEIGDKIIPKLLYHLVYQIPFSFFSYGSAIPSMTKTDYEVMNFPVPPMNEQQKIVAYLDYKTQKIDQLIEIKEKKIALLKEKRTALINHVVTKGLEPSMEMKDSSVEWIGEIPKHWEMKRVKYLFEIRKRISGELGYDVLSITQKGIKVKDIVTGKGQLSMDYRKYQIVEPMDFAMNHMDLLTGFVDVSKHLGVTSPDYRVFTLIDKESSHDYYLFLLQFGYINKVFYGFGQGSSMFGRWRLPAKEFLNFQFPYPPLEEQEAIVKYLNEQFDEIDKTIEFEQKKIDLLKEYRQALISEVVTGKRRVYEENHSMQYEAQ